MKPSPAPPAGASTKASTGITGFDEMTGGGLPRGRTTLLVGGPGSGKTILALQFLVNGAQKENEPGIFVAFEETSKRIASNADSFGWKLDELQRAKQLFFVDAQPSFDVVHSGDFDLAALQAALDGQVQEMGARRIVFDALDIVLALLPDPMARRREIYRMHDWLLARELTGLVTAKAGADGNTANQEPFGFMQFMVDCGVILSHNVVFGVSQRNLRVEKYRGSSFDENESPFLIGKNGIELAVARTLVRVDAKVSSDRVSSGVERLDTMLGGGYYRGAYVLVTGFPGTAKTTLGGAFAEAACRRGERTMFVSFDSDGPEVIRNLASVGIKLAGYVESDSLRVVSARTITGSAETYLVRIKSLAEEHRARCLVIDPVSALSTSGNELTAHAVAERLINWAKGCGITLICTSLLDEISGSPDRGGSQLQIATLADTWIHLSYLVQSGERNRSMSIIKSRGTAHSNQVRELILSDAGVTLADTYTAGGEVLMGTLRWQKESADRVSHELTEVAEKLKLVKLDADEAELQVRLRSLHTELVAKQVEKELLIRTKELREEELARGRSHIRELRGADDAVPGKE